MNAVASINLTVATFIMRSPLLDGHLTSKVVGTEHLWTGRAYPRVRRWGHSSTRRFELLAEIADFPVEIYSASPGMSNDNLAPAGLTGAPVLPHGGALPGWLLVIEPAAYLMPGGNLFQHRRVGPADIHHLRAAGVKRASGGHVGRTRHVSLEHDPLAPPLRIKARHRTHKRFRIRVLRLLVERRARRHFNDLTEVHHRHPVADMLDDAEVV